MAAKSGGEPTGKLADGIKAAFGDSPSSRSNSPPRPRAGSVRLGLAAQRRRETLHHEHAQPGHPLMEGKKAILGLDVWETSYY